MEYILDKIGTVETLEGLHEQIPKLRDLFDVEHLVYHSVNSTGQQYAMLTYSEDWVQHYLDRDYARTDPVVLGCWQRFHPVDWRNLDWTAKPQRAFIAEARDAGIGEQGFSVPIRGPNGQFALFTVNDRRSDSEWERYTSAHINDVLLLAHFLNQKALEIERGTDHVEAKKLSPREIDALTLLAMGMSRAQAAEQLSISEHTLRVYIESARFKLGASNTVHSVARALSRGLLVI